MNQKFQQAREHFRVRYGFAISDERIAGIQRAFPKPKIRERSVAPPKGSDDTFYSHEAPFLMRDRVRHTYTGNSIEHLYMGWLMRMSELMESMTRQPGAHWAMEMAHKIRRAKREDKTSCRTITTV